jgi:hypothetical protein
MLLFVTLVSELRLTINDLLDCCSHCKCLSRSGKKLPCIFIVSLPRTQLEYDSIWVIVDQLTKEAHFYTCQDHLVWAATSRVVYVEDSLSAWSAKEDCV